MEENDEPLFVEDPQQDEVIDLADSSEPHDDPENNNVNELFMEPSIGAPHISLAAPSKDADLDGDMGKSANESEQSNADANDTTSSQPVVDRIKLASLLKDFDARNDSLFRNVPDFVAEIVKEMLENDFLLVLGKGMGLAIIMRIFLAKVRQIASNALVLVLGHRSEDESYGVGNADVSSITDEESDEPQTITFGVSSAKRSKLYQSGGAYHVTGPIAVVDILTGVLDCSNISGLVISHGESVREDSTMAFVIRLLKQRNPMAFIKALSDAPERLIIPPSLPLKLRVLGVPTLMLWPRFHLSVDRSLPKLAVDEIIVEQNAAVRGQQALLSEMMQAVISDIKRRVPHLDVDFLAPELGPQQSNPDRLHASMNVDTLLSSNDFPHRVRNALNGVWHQLSIDGRNSVHSLATLQQLQNTLTVFDAKTFYVQLEFARRDTSQPWTDLPVVSSLLSDARRSAALRRMPGKFYHVRDLLKNLSMGSKVIILCNSLKTVMDLHLYLSRPDEDNAADEEALRELEAEMKKKDEEDLKLKAAKEAAAINAGRPGRRRVRGGGHVTSTPRVKQEVEEEGTEDRDPKNEETSSTGKRAFDEIDLTGDEPDYLDLSNDEITSSYDKIEVTIATYRGNQSLDKVHPDHVIMYDPNLYFTREVERFVASENKSSGKSQVEVHFMYYQQSAEELQYLTAMRREKDAFSRLIREKGLMPMHLQDGDATGGSEETNPSLSLSSSRRKYQMNQVQARVVVDVREFRSALPFHIWQTRVDVIPLTLLVGDYILTPDIVVERKSISDLIGSFRDGRLYQQCEAMLKYYKIACLLLEFDNKSYFTMEPFKDIRTRSADVQREIQENLCTLMLRFPKLRLLWSSSPVHSAQIIQGLKEFEPEPVPDECAKAGQSMLMDSAALSMLEVMPGLSPRNAPLIAHKVANINELVQMSREDLVDILGSPNGETLWRFLNNEKRKL